MQILPTSLLTLHLMGSLNPSTLAPSINTIEEVEDEVQRTMREHNNGEIVAMLTTVEGDDIFCF